MAATKYHEGRFPPGQLDWPKLIPLIGPAIRPIFDAVWNAGGYEQSRNYDEDGNRKPQH